MKKVFTILCSLFALVGCNKELPVNETVAEGEIQVALSVRLSDGFSGTKASVKTGWADGDVVFVFFKGVSAPKYLEMRYDGGSWTSTAMNGLSVSDLTGAADKKMTAVFLPYGSDAVVSADETDFILGEDAYCGYFLQAVKVPYAYDTKLLGTLEMALPAPVNEGERFVHFDISGFTSGNAHCLYQAYVKPLTFGGVAADGSVFWSESEAGKAIKGYEAGTMMSFSGILDADAVGVEKVYEFSVDDSTASVLYTRDAGARTVGDARCIGLGHLMDWTATDYVYLGLDNPAGQRIMWATHNLGASSEMEYGLFFSWAGTTGYTLTGSSGNYSSEHDFRSTPTYELDENYNLKPAYDAAHVALKGLWRLPTKDEMDVLASNAQSEFEGSGPTFGMRFKGVNDYYGNSIFLTAAGYIMGTTPEQQEDRGVYWGATSLAGGGPSCGHDLNFVHREDPCVVLDFNTSTGKPVRPVFTID